MKLSNSFSLSSFWSFFLSKSLASFASPPFLSISIFSPFFSFSKIPPFSSFSKIPPYFSTNDLKRTRSLSGSNSCFRISRSCFSPSINTYISPFPAVLPSQPRTAAWAFQSQLPADLDMTFPRGTHLPEGRFWRRFACPWRRRRRPATLCGPPCTRGRFVFRGGTF